MHTSRSPTRCSTSFRKGFGSIASTTSWVCACADVESPVHAAGARHATKVYGTGDTAVTALDDLSIELPRGQFTAIMGPSGSGKSTLMHCLAGLDTLTSGQVFVGPTDLSHALGVPGQLSHPLVEEAFETIVRELEGSPAALGVLVPNADEARRWRERGARYIAVTVDSLLVRGARELLAAVRATAGANV